MANQIEYKNVATQPVDTTGRKVKVVISELGNTDLDNDIIDKGAYDKTLKERGPQGSNLIWHLTDHNPSLKAAVGKFSSLAVEGNQLVGVTDIPATTWGNDVLEMYKSGLINQHSVGFSTVRAEVSDDPNEARVIKEIKLYEGSAVLWGANPNTPTLDAGMKWMKGLVEIETHNLIQDLNWFQKVAKVGRLSDETHELIEIHVKQLIDKLKALQNNSTQAAAPAAPAPDAKRKAFAKHLQLASLTI